MKDVRNMILVFTCLALLGAMQANAVNYSQQPVKQTYGQPMHVTSGTAPSATFHSTSTMIKPAGAYSATSTLNANGTVNAGAYGIGSTNVSGPRRVGGTASPGEGGGSSGNLNDQSGNDPNENGTPIGDALIPLTLLAGAYLIIRAVRRKVRSRISEG